MRFVTNLEQCIFAVRHGIMFCFMVGDHVKVESRGKLTFEGEIIEIDRDCLLIEDQEDSCGCILVYRHSIEDISFVRDSQFCDEMCLTKKRQGFPPLLKW